MSNPIEALETVGKIAAAVEPVARTIKALGSLFEKTHAYVNGEPVDLPDELPQQLRSDVELARLDALAAKAKP